MSYIKIDSASYFHNLNLLSKKLGSIDRLAVVLKDNAYGHDKQIIAKLASDFGVKRAVVKNLNEANTVRDFFEKVTVLYDKPTTKIEKKISVTMNSIQALKTVFDDTNIELKIDSGMHRNGIDPSEIERSFKIIKERRLNLVGVLTHFGSADDLSSELFWQIKNWQEIKQKVLSQIKKYNLPKPLFHSANSATLLRVNSYEDDFARCGIATYGYSEMDKIFGEFNLKPVMSLWGERVSTRELLPSQRVGYGGVFKSLKSMIISTYDIGYGDGFFRYDGLGNLKTACEKNICGRVSMDFMSIDSNHDEICIFDDARKLAKYFGTITYEITTKLSPFIKRVVV